MLKPLDALIIRYADRIEVNERGCWIWQGATTADRGYAWIMYKRHTWLGHKLFYEAFIERPNKNHTHHKCENNACINPHHMEEITITEHGRLTGHLKRMRYYR